MGQFVRSIHFWPFRRQLLVAIKINNPSHNCIDDFVLAMNINDTVHKTLNNIQLFQGRNRNVIGLPSTYASEPICYVFIYKKKYGDTF